MDDSQVALIVFHIFYAERNKYLKQFVYKYVKKSMSNAHGLFWLIALFSSVNEPILAA
jgi:hypothetical protein